jgi:hypothetical protein
LEQFGKGILHFDDSRFAITVLVDTADPAGPYMELIHKTRDGREGDRIVRDRIRLVCTVPTYGGRRWWFVCPRTARRTRKLFLPNGGWHFWSRQAYGLGHACQREDRFSRLQRRAAKLNRQLGGEGLSTWADPPKKPKGMHWQTYFRKYVRWARVVERANQEFVRKSMRMLTRPTASRRIVKDAAAPRELPASARPGHRCSPAGGFTPRLTRLRVAAPRQRLP